YSNHTFYGEPDLRREQPGHLYLYFSAFRDLDSRRSRHLDSCAQGDADRPLGCPQRSVIKLGLCKVLHSALRMSLQGAMWLSSLSAGNTPLTAVRLRWRASSRESSAQTALLRANQHSELFPNLA